MTFVPLPILLEGGVNLVFVVVVVREGSVAVAIGLILLRPRRSSRDVGGPLMGPLGQDAVREPRDTTSYVVSTSLSEKMDASR